MQRLLEERGLAEGFRWQLRRPDGSAVWVSESVHAVRDGTGRVLYYEGTVELS
jgi:PAS domain-containing protein